MIHFDENALRLIRESVARAEKKTSGEISSALIPESSDYAAYELLFSIFAALVIHVVLVVFRYDLLPVVREFHPEATIEQFLLWNGYFTFVMISLVYLLLNRVPFLDRLVIPQSVMQEKVMERARLHYQDTGIASTRDHTGILIFISWLERRVVVLADKSISSKIEQSQWDDIVSRVIEGIKKEDLPRYLSQAIEMCGDMLARHFPIKPDDINELNDDLILLDK